MKIRALVIAIFVVFLASNAYSLPPVKSVCELNGQSYELNRQKLLYWALGNAQVKLLCIVDSETGKLPENESLLEALHLDTHGDFISPSCQPAKEASEHTASIITLENSLENFKKFIGNTPSKEKPYGVKNAVHDANDISTFGLYSKDANVVIDCFKADPNADTNKKNIVGKVLFRENVDEFAKAKFEDASGGKISYESEKGDSDKATNTSKFAFGYRFSFKKPTANFTSITPYMTLDSSKVVTESVDADSNEPTSSTEQKEEKGIGISAQQTFDPLGKWLHELSYSLTYVDEKYKETEFTDLALVYIPKKRGLLSDWLHFGPFHIYPELKLQAKRAEIVDAGTLEGDDLNAIIEVEEYFAYGGELGFKLRSRNKDFQKTEFSASYGYYGLDLNQKSDTDITKVNLTYYLDENAHYGIVLSYEEGETGILFDKVDKWSVAFSIRN